MDLNSHLTWNDHWCFSFHIFLLPGTFVELLLPQRHLVCLDVSTLRVLDNRKKTHEPVRRLALRDVTDSILEKEDSYLIYEADGRRLAAVQELDVYDLQLLQTNVEGFELTVVAVQWDDLKQPVVQPQANHTALRIHDPDDPGFRRTANAILTNTQLLDEAWWNMLAQMLIMPRVVPGRCREHGWWCQCCLRSACTPGYRRCIWQSKWTEDLCSHPSHKHNTQIITTLWESDSRRLFVPASTCCRDTRLQLDLDITLIHVQ